MALCALSSMINLSSVFDGVFPQNLRTCGQAQIATSSQSQLPENAGQKDRKKLAWRVKQNLKGR